MKDMRHKLFIGLGALFAPVIAHLLLSCYYSDGFVLSNAYYLHCFFLLPLVAIQGAILGAKYDIYLKEKQESDSDQIIEDWGLPKKGIEKGKLTAKHMASDVGYSLVGMMAGATLGVIVVFGIGAIIFHSIKGNVFSSSAQYLIVFIGVICAPFVFMFFAIKGSRQGVKLSESKRSNNQSSLQESDNARRDSFYEVSNSDEKNPKDDSKPNKKSTVNKPSNGSAGLGGIIGFVIAIAVIILSVKLYYLYGGSHDNGKGYAMIFLGIFFAFPFLILVTSLGVTYGERVGSPNSVNLKYSLRNRLKGAVFGFFLPWFFLVCYLFRTYYAEGIEGIFPEHAASHQSFMNYVLGPLLCTIPCMAIGFAMGTSEDD